MDNIDTALAAFEIALRAYEDEPNEQTRDEVMYTQNVLDEAIDESGIAPF